MGKDGRFSVLMMLRYVTMKGCKVCRRASLEVTTGLLLLYGCDAIEVILKMILSIKLDYEVISQVMRHRSFSMALLILSVCVRVRVRVCVCV